MKQQEIKDPILETNHLTLKALYKAQYSEGKYVDIVDSIHQWCAGQIIKIDEDMATVHFDGWSSKWDMEVDLNSNKVAPFRMYSKGYTGQTKIALRLSQKFERSGLDEEKKRVEGLIKNDFKGLGPFQTTQYFRGTLYFYVDFLMDQNKDVPKLTEDDLDAVNDFLCTVLKLIVSYIKMLPSMIDQAKQSKFRKCLDIKGAQESEYYLIYEDVALFQCSYELLDILNKLFCCCSRCIKYYLYYDKNVQNSNIIDFVARRLDIHDGDSYDVDEMNAHIDFGQEIEYGQLTNFVNYFFEIGGLKAIQDVLNCVPIENIPLSIMLSLISPFRNCKKSISENTRKDFVLKVQSLFCKKISLLSQQELITIDNVLGGKILIEFYGLLQLYYDAEDTSDMTGKLLQDLILIQIQSNDLEIKINGGKLLKKLTNKSKASKQLNLDSKGKIGKLIKKLQYDDDEFNEWMIEEQILEILIGNNNVLPSIIFIGGKLFQHLAKSDRLKQQHIDIIWNCQFNNSKETIAIARIFIEEVVPLITLDLVNYIDSKIQALSQKDYTIEFLTFLRAFTMKSLKLQAKQFQKQAKENKKDDEEADYETSCSIKELNNVLRLQELINDSENQFDGPEQLYGLTIFWNMIISNESNFECDSMREYCSKSLIVIFQQNSSLNLRLPFTVKCIKNINNRQSILPSLAIMTALLKRFPDSNDNEGGFLTQIDLIYQLESQIQIIDLLINVIVDKSNESKDCSNLIASENIGTQEALIKTDIKDPNAYISNVISDLLVMIRNLILISKKKVLFGTKNITILWDLIITKPQIYKLKFLDFFELKQDLLTEEEEQFLYERILDQMANTDKSLSTKELTNLFLIYFEKVCISNDIFIIGKVSKTLQVKDFNKIDERALTILWNNLDEEGDSHNNILIQIYSRFFKEIAIDIREGIWKDFICKIMNKLAKDSQQPDCNNLKTLKNLKYFIELIEGKGDKVIELTEDQLSNQRIIEVLNQDDLAKKKISVSRVAFFYDFRKKIAESFGLDIMEFNIMLADTQIDLDEYDNAKLSTYVSHNTQVSINRNQHYNPFVYPKNITANTDDYFNILFKMLDSQDDALVEQTWSLLIFIPFNQGIKIELEDYKQVEKDISTWNLILNQASLCQLYYKIKIIISLYGERKTQKSLQWRIQFIKLGGFDRLITILCDINIAKVANSRLKLECIFHLFQIIVDFMYFDKSLIQRITPSKAQIVITCIRTIDKIIQNRINQKQKNNALSYYELNEKIESEALQKQHNVLAKKSNDGSDEEDNSQSKVLLCLEIEYLQFQQPILRLIRFCTEGNNNNNVIMTLFTSNEFKEMYQSLQFKYDCQDIKEDISELIKDMLKQIEGDPQQISCLNYMSELVFVEFMKYSKDVQDDSIALYFYIDVSEQIKQIKNDKLKTIQNKLLIIADNIANFLLERECKESAFYETDYLLNGQIQLLKSILEKLPQIKLRIGNSILKYLLDTCLYQIPDKLISNKLNVPKYKSHKTRKLCVDLINVLCHDCLPNLNSVMECLGKINTGTWRTHKATDWNCTSKILLFQKNSTKRFVGLKDKSGLNPTIYQIFMIPEVRECIFSINFNVQEDNPAAYEMDYIYQLQLLFSGLKYSEKQLVNPAKVLTAYLSAREDTINIFAIEEKDLIQFFDITEQSIKKHSNTKSIKQIFQGSITHESICKNCQHKHYREDPFISLPIEVKRTHSIQEGLDNYFRGIKEENKIFHCENCDQQHQSSSTLSISKLPQNLIVFLNREYLNQNTKIQECIKTYFSFPLEIDMAPYSSQGRIQIEEQKLSLNENIEQVDKLDDYMYDLIGIEVHSFEVGTDDFWLIAKDQETQKWHKIHDEIVEDFDMDKLPSECFGGSEQRQKDPFFKTHIPSSKEKKMAEKNAFQLIYRRREKVNKEEKKIEQYVDAPIVNDQIQIGGSLNDIQKKVQSRNAEYWSKQFVFCTEYQSLVYNIACFWNTSCIIPELYLNKNDDFELLKLEKPKEYLSNKLTVKISDTPLKLSEQATPQELEATELNVFKFTFDAYIGVIQRTLNPHLHCTFMGILKSYINKNIECAKYVIQKMSNEHLLKETLIQRQSELARQTLTGIIYCAMLKIYPFEKDDLDNYWKILDSNYELADTLLQQQYFESNVIIDEDNQEQITMIVREDAYTSLGNLILLIIKNLFVWRRYRSGCLEYLQIVTRFSTLGAEARQFLLKTKIVGRLLDYFYDQQSPYNDDFRNMSTIKPKLNVLQQTDIPIHKQKDFDLRESEAPFNKNYQYLFEIISNCLRSIANQTLTSPYSLDKRQTNIITQEIDLLLPESKFLKKIFYYGLNVRTTNQLCKGFYHYYWISQNDEYFVNLIEVYTAGLQEADFDQIYPFLMLVEYMVAIPYEEENDQETRLATILGRFLELVKLNENYFTVMDDLFNFIIKLSCKYPHVRQWFETNLGTWEWMFKWFDDNGVPPNPTNTTGQIKFVKVYGNNEERKEEISEYYRKYQENITIKTATRLALIKLVKDSQLPDISKELDSDMIDMQDHKFVEGECFYLYNRYTGDSYLQKVEFVTDEYLEVQNCYANDQGLQEKQWFVCDYEDMIPVKAIQRKLEVIQFKLTHNTLQIKLSIVVNLDDNVGKDTESDDDYEGRII